MFWRADNLPPRRREGKRRDHHNSVDPHNSFILELKIHRYIYLTQLELSSSCNVFNMRFSSIILILALASSQAATGPRRRAQEVDNDDVTLDDSITLIEPIADDPTEQPTMAPTEWVATTEPTIAKPSKLPTSVPIMYEPTTADPSGNPTAAPSGIPTAEPSTASLVTDESTNAPTEEEITLEPSFVTPTVSPTIGCIDYARDFNGGDIEDYCHTLHFEYEVETLPNLSLFALEQSLIPSVEDAITDSLTPLVVGECRNDEGVRRLLSDRNIDMLHNAMNTHRRAQIFGLGASPTDTRRGGAGSTCQSIRTSPNHRCSVISGAVTVCSANFANDKAEVMNVIQEGMEDDTYKDAHKAIVKLFFIGEDADAKEEVGNAGGGEDSAVPEFNDKNEKVNGGSGPSEDSPLSVGSESSSVIVDDAKEDEQPSDGDAEADSNGDRTGNESDSARNSVTITHPLQGAKLWGVLLGVIAAIFTFVLLGKKLAEDNEYDYANDDGGEKAGTSETSSSEDEGEQV